MTSQPSQPTRLTLEEAWIISGLTGDDDRTFEEYCEGAQDLTGADVCFRHPDRISPGCRGAGNRPICRECYDTYWTWAKPYHQEEG